MNKNQPPSEPTPGSAERADRLRRTIDDLQKGKGSKPEQPETPRDFVNRRMEELGEEAGVTPEQPAESKPESR
jgi:hypothetical protein